MEDCIFCKIINGEIPSYKVYEDGETLAILDINPINAGHTLIISKTHVTRISMADEEDLLALAKTIKKVVEGVEKSMDVNSLNVFVNQGKDAGQIIPHLHYHVVPRHKDDGVKFDVVTKDLSEKEFMDVFEKIKGAIG